MSDQFAKGTVIRTAFQHTATVLSFIAAGGQGMVYLVDYNGQKKAMKWYKPSFIADKGQYFYEHIRSNVRRGSPSKEFLWPLDITEWMDESFGYIMDLKPDGYYEITDYMLGNVHFSSYRTIIDASLSIVSAYRHLHNDGYSYQDLNHGNFFIKPDTGKVLICDTDNIAPDGEQTGIVGTPRFMAPEVVMNRSMPNSLSDRFSMSVVLFILFCLNHPLEGKRYLVPSLTPVLQEKLYGSEALFMMDPTDHGNEPHPIVHRNILQVWPCLPDYMQEFFCRTFSQKALFKPSARPSEIEWLQLLTRFRSEIVTCACGNEIFTQEGRPCKCDACGKVPRIPFRLEFRDYSIPAMKGSRIYRCQLGVCSENVALSPVAVVLKKTDAASGEEVFGILNKYGKKWDAITTHGTHRKVSPEEVVPLKDGIVLNIEDASIRISKNK